MVRKEILTILTQDGYPTNEKPKEKTEKMHPKMKKYWIAFFAILALAAIIGYFALAAQTPVKTATDASAGGDAKATPVPAGKEAVAAGAAGIATANSAAADTETGKIEVPADAWILKVGDVNLGKNDDNTFGPELVKRTFLLGKTPKTIWVQQRHTFFKEVKITAREITGIAVNEWTTKGSSGTQSAIHLYFFENGEFIKAFTVETDVGLSGKPGYSGKEFKMKFPEEVWGADSVAIEAPR